jgi:hypothetical protein
LGNADVRVEGHRSFEESIDFLELQKVPRLRCSLFGAAEFQPLQVALRRAAPTALRELVAEVFQVSQAKGRAQICAKVNPILLRDGEENFDNLGIELRA